MGFDIWQIIDTLPAIIIGLTVHEFAHAYTALKLGDDTAKNEGRVTLNPLVHIDLIGFIVLIIAGFGWAKPVRFDEKKFKHPRRDGILVALAGPVSNALLAILISLVYVFIIRKVPSDTNSFDHSLRTMVQYGIFINWGLFLFNLVPIPPLDGSHILFRLSNIKPEVRARLFTYGSYIFLGIILLQTVGHIPIIPIGTWAHDIGNGFLHLLGWG